MSPFDPVNTVVQESYRNRIEVWAILGCAVLVISLVELIRRQKLKEKYSLLWFATSLVLLVVTLKRSWLEDVAAMFGVYYPPTALFLILVFFLLLILIHFSTVVSKLQNDSQTLTQHIGILEAKLDELQREENSADKNQRES